MSETNKPRIDFSQIGQADWNNLASTFLDAIERFYEDPVNRARFEEWQAKQQEKEVSNGKGSKRRRQSAKKDRHA